MKKMYRFLSMFCLLLLTGGTAWAQDSDVMWEVDANNPATTIEPGAYYALRYGTNATFDPTAFLSTTGEPIHTPDVTAIFQFEEDGSVETGGETLPLYILRNVGNGQYLSTGGYVRSRSEAFHFTALLATGYPEGTELSTLTELERRSAAQNTAQPGVDGQTFVFASAEPDDEGLFTYICYYGNPGFWQYFDTNAWFVLNATSRAKTAMELLQDAYNALFGESGLDETVYPVGTAPGCISQEVYNQLDAAYQAYFAVTGNPGASDAELNAVTEQLREAAAALESGRVLVTPGYYIMRSQRSNNAAYDDGSQVHCTGNYAIPESYTLSNARYIWQVVDAGNGNYQLRNFYTGRYINASPGTSNSFTTSVESTATFTFPLDGTRFFNIMDQNGNLAHCDGSNYFVQWNDAGTPPNQWEFTPVPDDVIATLSEQVAQQQLMDALASTLDDARAAKLNRIYDSDVTFDDSYASEGLADPALMQTNAPESGEGYDVADQFTQLSDGDLQTYFHTAWSNNNATTWHYVQVDLGKAVQNLFVKFSQRHNHPAENNPLKVAFVTNDDPNAEVWTDTLRRDSVIYQYATNYAAGRRDSSTAVMRVSFDRPVQHLRFAVTGTWANTWHGAGVCWYVSELRFYEDGGNNPLYDMIPQELRDELDRQIGIAEAALADSVPTQAIIDALQEAIDAFVEAYPDPTAFENLLENARAQAEAAEEGDELGYFQEGAKAEFTAALDQIDTEIAGKNLTLDELDEYTQRVYAALDAFNARLNVPEDGFYYIQINNADSPGNGAYVYADNAGEEAAARWGYADDENYTSRINLIWQLSHNDDGSVSLRNVGTGRYLTNIYTGVADPDTLGLSASLPVLEQADGFDIVFSGTPGVFNIELANGYYVNAEPTGAVVNWNSQGGNSDMVFLPMEFFDGIHMVDVTPNTMRVVTVPFPVDVEMSSLPLYKVLGQRTDGEGNAFVQLSPYAEDEDVPAGTPFVVNNDTEESTLMLGLPYFDAEEFLANVDYVYSPVLQNGLASAPTAVQPGAGYGILVDGEIQITNDDDQVEAGSGYFTDEIPATDEVGDLEIPISGLIISAIPGAPAVDTDAEVVDVYTISGMKLRGRVKAADATKGLPTGLYIVGGKKVFVK